MYNVFEIIKGRFEFNRIRTDENISGYDIKNWYLNTDRADEEIIETFGDHLIADGIFCNVMDEAHSDYDRLTGILTGYLYILQCSKYDDDGEFIQGNIIRIHAESVIQK